MHNKRQDTKNFEEIEQVISGQAVFVPCLLLYI